MNDSLSIITSEGASNEFPVLKAFQQYIDAEQAKARKRMLGLSIFFIILLVVVVVTFVLVLTTVVNRNQALSDRLLDYALKEKEQKQQMVQQPVVQQSAMQQASSIQEVMKPFFERLEREQAAMKAMYEKRQKEIELRYEQQRKDADARIREKEKANEDELRRAKAELERERMRIQRENDRQAEIERHRRRLYPDYYRIPESQPAPAATLPSAPASQPTAETPRRQTQPAAKPVESPPAAKKALPLSKMKPVSYFNVDDEDGVPFLLETPQKENQK